VAKLQDSIDKAVEAGARRVVIDMIRESPKATLGDILELTKGKWGSVARTITIGELLAGAPRAGRRGRATGGRQAPTGAVNTKTPAGRKRYDAAVLSAVRAARSPVSAAQIRAAVGGTPLQTRTALNRLIDAGKVKWTGKARGTRYRSA
jgi:hypothetical protein